MEWVGKWAAQGIEPWELAVASKEQIQDFLKHCKVQRGCGRGALLA